MAEPADAAPGRYVQELVSVMDQLRSPGGCPWDAEQTHESLIPYVLEEAYEVVEAIESGTRADVVEELGDLLLQVVFHARIAQEHPTEPFDIDDVARAISQKLKRRHPYVFPAAASADVIVDDVTSVAEQEVTWEATKAAEKQRESVFDGIPVALSPLMRAQKILHRARRAGLTAHAPLGTPPGNELHGWERDDGSEETASKIGAELLDIVRRASDAKIDAEGALRAIVRDLENELRGLEEN